MEESLRLRLEMAAQAYRKLYVQKQRLENKLTKLRLKIQEKNKGLGVQHTEQPATAELISLSHTADTDSRANVWVLYFMFHCMFSNPFLDVSFCQKGIYSIPSTIDCILQV